MGNDCIAEARCIAPVSPRGDKPADNLEHNFDQVFHFLFPFFSFSIFLFKKWRKLFSSIIRLFLSKRIVEKIEFVVARNFSKVEISTSLA